MPQKRKLSRSPAFAEQGRLGRHWRSMEYHIYKRSIAGYTEQGIFTNGGQACFCKPGLQKSIAVYGISGNNKNGNIEENPPCCHSPEACNHSRYDQSVISSSCPQGKSLIGSQMNVPQKLTTTQPFFNEAGSVQSSSVCLM